MNPESPSVCLLRLSALGDVSHVLPLVHAFRQQQPQTRLSWIIGAGEAQLMAGLEGVELLPYRKKDGWAGTRKLWQQLRGRRFDALLLMQQAATASLKKAQPGTPEFRGALRDALESTSQFVASQAVYNMTPNDHNGVDQRSQVMVRIDKSGWKLMP